MSGADVALLITTSYARAGDGSEAAGAFVSDLAQELAGLMPVRVVAPGRSEEVGMHGAVEVWSFEAPDKPLSLLSPGDPRNWLAIVRTLRSLRRTVLAANGDARIRHALAFWVLPSGWAARALKRKSGIPYSVWALGSDIWSLGRIPLIRGFLRGVSRDAAQAYADGMRLGQDAERVTGRRFDFLPSTRKLTAVRLRPVSRAAPYRLLFLGRWHPNKGVDLLIAALALLGDEDWARIDEVHLAGGGPLKDEVTEGVAALRAAGRPVRLSGYLDREQASRAFGEADRLLLPSRIESIPVVFSDAMKFALPVVSMPVGDLPSLIREGTGWLALSVDADAFADAIRACLHSGHDDGALGSMNERFSLERIAQRIASHD
ncbi:MAG TPA: glycosyltransferase [Novosphingobium sp.]|uniref:glycosyltransferase n=1 Tax=Lysobacter TaxID=68 RepID=UPI0004D01D9E|nr:glycosyltransferase [Lysobacter antibioticus]HKX80269.1 glycosyltransferase [Novosphingobium sp.]